ncbi:5'-nucleotidase C-terminal domain-containing protein [Mycoplasma sp. VS42A]|uniref:5'-nucleotidase C-terminal domain-containing protein n=1 Tax=Mycoplasma sp. VS42A TaxID=3398774 RepID=UPI003A88A9DA
MKNRTKWFLKLMPLGTAAITLPLAVVSCNDPEKDQIKAQLDKLKGEKSSLDSRIAALEAQLNDSKGSADQLKDVQAQLEKLKAEKTATANAILAVAKDQYKEASKAYDAKLKELALKLKEVKGLKDETEKTKGINELKTRVTNELQPLSVKHDQAFNLLRKAEKDANSRIKTIKIFHSNDEHGRIKMDDGKYSLYSGMIRTGEYLNGKARDLLLSAGDMIQGLPLSDTDKGKTITHIARNIGYEAIAVGNHEFDYGLKHILDLNAELNEEKEVMPFLSANIYYKELSAEDQKSVEGYDASKVGQRAFKPYIVKELESGIKVGIFGLTTPDTSVTSHPRNSRLVKFTEPVEESKKVVAEIRKEHPDINFIICIAHLGKGRSNAAWTSEYLAAHTDNELDLILDGHSHTLIHINNNDNKDVYVTQTEAYTKYLGDIELEFDTQTGKIVSQKQVLRDMYEIAVATINDVVDPNSPNEKLLKALEDIYKAENDKLVFTSTQDFVHTDSVNIDGVPYWRGRVEPTTLGMLFTNAAAWNYMNTKAWEGQEGAEAASLDNTFGLMNGGGLRENITKGEVTYGKMRGISPFGNRPNVIQVKGDRALQAIKYGLSKARSGGFSQLSSNVTYEVEINKELNPKTQKQEYMWKAKEGTIKINGKAIDPNKYYYICTNDYLAAGGDGYTMLNYVKDKDEVKLMYEGLSLIEETIKFVKHILTPDVKLDASKFEKTFDEFANKDTLKGQVVNIPAEAGEKPVPTAD